MSEKMTTSEPTTGEIVSALRNCPNCDDCLRKDQKCYRNDHDAADRLESQEAQIKQLTEALAYANEWHKESVESATNELRELSGIAGELEAMTARAESAEAKEKAMVDYLRGYCQFCEHDDCMEEELPCCDCENVTHDGRECKWELRGKPQEGDKE